MLTRRIILHAISAGPALWGRIGFRGLIGIGLWPAVSFAQQTVPGEALRALIKIHEQIDSFVDYYNKAVPIIRERRLPPPAPMSDGGGSALALIQRAKALASAVPEQLLLEPFAATGAIGGSPDSVRVDIAERVRMFQRAAREFGKERIENSRLRRVGLQSQQTAQMFQRVSGAVLQARTEVGEDLFDTLLRPLSHFAVDVMGGSSINAELLAIHFILKEKASRGRTHLDERRVQLIGVAGFILGALAREAEALEADVKRLTELMSELEDHVETNRLLGELFQREQSLLVERSHEVADLRNRSGLLEADQAHMNRRVQEADRRIAELEPIVRNGVAGYGGCPNGAAWARCDHHDYKAAFKRDLDQKKEELAQMRTTVAERRRRRVEIDAQLKDVRNRIKQAEPMLARQRDRVELIGREFAADSEQLRAKSDHYWKEKFRSRATEHAAAIEAETRYLNDELSRLNVPIAP